MKRMIAGFIFLLLVLGSCNNKKSNNLPTRMSDSIHRLNEDSLAQAAKGPHQTNADELFNDFIYNFASDPAIQRQRIVFPLLVDNGGKKSFIDARHWKHDYLFIHQKIYTLIFDRQKDMDLVNDTSLKSVQVEWLYPKNKMVKHYNFKRVRGMWLLESINMSQMTNIEDETFLNFYGRFSTDSLFQAQRVCQPLKFVTANPDDDFSMIEATIDVSQWFAFKPQLPILQLSNINYGQQNSDKSIQKIVAFKGVSNGFSNMLYFRKKAGKWKLYKFEDTSM
ncbi:MAG: DUF4348 domain-containing protein [Bacteroidales bacterium]|nr:DUF4348 domain-containing protein [Bacteroidales bacterium]